MIEDFVDVNFMQGVRITLIVVAFAPDSQVVVAVSAGVKRGQAAVQSTEKKTKKKKPNIGPGSSAQEAMVISDDDECDSEPANTANTLTIPLLNPNWMKLGACIR